MSYTIEDLKGLVDDYRDRGEPDPPVEMVTCPLCGLLAKKRTIPTAHGFVGVIGCNCVKGRAPVVVPHQ